MSESSGRRGAIFFALANLVAGVLHYLFQVWSSVRLDVVDFGKLNSWIAYYSISLSVGAFAQYGANFFNLNRSRLRLFSWSLVALSLLSLPLPWWVPQAGPLLIGMVGLLLGVLTSYLMGQAQARLAFATMGTSLLMIGISKFALAGASSPASEPYLDVAWAFGLSYAPGLLLLAIVIIIRESSWPRVAKSELSSYKGLGATAILSFASVLIPQMDVVVIHRTQLEQSIGEFARISLLYKGVFFGFQIFSQWLLPYQIGKRTESIFLIRWVSRSPLRTLFMALALAAAAIFVTFLVVAKFVPEVLEHPSWIVLSSLNMALLTNIFYFVQKSSVLGQIGQSSLMLAALLVELIVALVLRLSIDGYLLYALVLNFVWWCISYGLETNGFRKVFAAKSHH